MNIAMIAAMDRNRLIGSQGQLPWHLSADLRHFKAKTIGKPIIMGRRTYQSLGHQPLPKRRNIVVTHQPQHLSATLCEVASSVDHALQLAATDQTEIMVIGGRMLYEAILPRATTLYLTIIEHDFDGDCYFPAFDPTAWRCTEQQYYHSDQNNPYAFYTLTLTRILGVSHQDEMRSETMGEPPMLLQSFVGHGSVQCIYNT